MTPAGYRPARYPIQEIVTFSKVRNQKNPRTRAQMTTALIMDLRGHHAKALEVFQAAIKGAA